MITTDLLSAPRVELPQLVERLETLHQARHDLVISARQLSMHDGHLVVPNPESILTATGVATALRLQPTHGADSQLAELLGIPAPYLRRLRTEREVALLDANVTTWLRRQPVTRKVLVRGLHDGDGGGLVRALLSNSYEIVDNLDVLLAVLQGIQDAGAPVDIIRCDLTPTRMYVAIRSQQVAAMAPTLLARYVSPFTGARGADNPVVFAGFVVTNSETGGGALTITPRLEVQVCTNGLTLNEHRLREVHLGARLPEGTVRWQADTRHAAARLATTQARDAVTSFLDQSWVARRLAELETRAGVAVNDPVGIVEKVGKELRFSEAVKTTILSHFVRGGDATSGGVMQAVTSAAQTVEDPDEAWQVEFAGIRAMDLAARFASGS